ncbi:MAG: histidine phosphatase family protein, partial [Parachlamydiaceae bacterium]|nr:histidine phosphatase family protein [Parachlamydiaceae bacterium]
KDSRLRERNFGSWEGRLFSEYGAASPDDKSEVESNQIIQKRIFEFLQDIGKSELIGNNVLIVSHGGVLKNIIVKLLDLENSFNEINCKNAAYLIITYSEDVGWNIKELNGIELPLSLATSL